MLRLKGMVGRGLGIETGGGGRAPVARGAARRRSCRIEPEAGRTGFHAGASGRGRGTEPRLGGAALDYWA